MYQNNDLRAPVLLQEMLPTKSSQIKRDLDAQENRPYRRENILARIPKLHGRSALEFGKDSKDAEQSAVSWLQNAIEGFSCRALFPSKKKRWREGIEHV